MCFSRTGKSDGTSARHTCVKGQGEVLSGRCVGAIFVGAAFERRGVFRGGFFGGSGGGVEMKALSEQTHEVRLVADWLSELIFL